MCRRPVFLFCFVLVFVMAALSSDENAPYAKVFADVKIFCALVLVCATGAALYFVVALWAAQNDARKAAIRWWVTMVAIALTLAMAGLLIAHSVMVVSYKDQVSTIKDLSIAQYLIQPFAVIFDGVAIMLNLRDYILNHPEQD
jgi:hypothetical protein